MHSREDTWVDSCENSRVVSGELEAIHASVAIANRLGLHARAAAKFVKLAANFQADVLVGHKGQESGGLSIMGLMMLAAGPGCVITLKATGLEAAQAVAALSQLVNDKFGEN